MNNGSLSFSFVTIHRSRLSLSKFYYSFLLYVIFIPISKFVPQSYCNIEPEKKIAVLNIINISLKLMQIDSKLLFVRYIIYSMKWKFGNKINKRKLKAQWIVITFLINIYLSRMKIRKIIRSIYFLFRYDSKIRSISLRTIEFQPLISL